MIIIVYLFTIEQQMEVHYMPLHQKWISRIVFCHTTKPEKVVVPSTFCRVSKNWLSEDDVT